MGFRSGFRALRGIARLIFSGSRSTWFQVKACQLRSDNINRNKINIIRMTLIIRRDLIIVKQFQVCLLANIRMLWTIHLFIYLQKLLLPSGHILLSHISHQTLHQTPTHDHVILFLPPAHSFSPPPPLPVTRHSLSPRPFKRPPVINGRQSGRLAAEG